MKKLENKTAVVTGASSGMGKSIARLFALNGAKVVVVDLNPDNAMDVAEMIRLEGGRAIGLKCDVSNEIQD
jgi:NAD(P)-dependent dehydrogenase (short-subunit alcohol dehydrogenase family)